MKTTGKIRYDRKGREKIYVSAWIDRELVESLKRRLRIGTNAGLLYKALEALDRATISKKVESEVDKLAKELLEGDPE